MQGIGLLQSSDLPNGVRLINQAAEMGHPDAMTCMGQFAIEGAMGVPRNPQVALDWFTKAADSGNVEAAENLGTMRLHGDGVSVDKKEAARWFRKAADGGSEQSMATLAGMFIKGDGLPKDLQMGAQWLVKAAQTGGYLEELMERIEAGTLDPEEKNKLAEMIEQLKEFHRGNPESSFGKDPASAPIDVDPSPRSGW